MIHPRRRRDHDHVVSKRIVQATPEGGTIVLENLTGIRKRAQSAYCLNLRVRDKLPPDPRVGGELLTYQLDLTTPGNRPWCAHSLITLRDKPKSL